MAIGKGYEEILGILKRMGELRKHMEKLDEQIGLLPEPEVDEQPVTEQLTQSGGTTVE